MLALALAVSLSADAPQGTVHGKLLPPARVTLPRDPNRPALSNPQLSADGSHVYVARLPPAGAPPAAEKGVDVLSVPLEGKGAIQTLSFPDAFAAPPVRVLLSRNERSLCLLAGGELWLRTLAPGDKPAAPVRLYPPAAGDAALGPKLSQADLSADGTFALVESPQGWARVSLDSEAGRGTVGPLPLNKVDLTSGGLAFSSDGIHALMVRTQRGEGFLNGGKIIALNIERNFPQVLDKDHDYLDVGFLPDGRPLGVDSAGSLFVIAPKQIPYFTPPAGRQGGGEGSVGAYSLALLLGKLAWTVVPTNPVQPSELWVAGAPPPPTKPKRESQFH